MTFFPIQNKRYLFLLSIFIFFLSLTHLFAWDTKNGVAICTTTNNQSFPRITSDGNGGAIIAWWDERVGSGRYGIYAQRVNSIGSTLWGLDGVGIGTISFQPSMPSITSDGFGGAFIAWHDNRFGELHVYVQRLNSSGSTLWTLGGVTVCSHTAKQANPGILSDNQGGCLVTWQDARPGNYDVYAQRLSPTGSILWNPQGVAVCTAAAAQSPAGMISDNQGGVILCWQDDRRVSRSGRKNGDIFAQRLNPSGTALWENNGIAICTAAYDQEDPTITSDSSGGAIILWKDHRKCGECGGWGNVYAQRINSSGYSLWTINGVGVYVPDFDYVSDLFYPIMTPDNNGGAIIAWYGYNHDNRNCQIYSQRVSSSGTVLWEPEMVAVCTGASNQYYPHMISDNAGGAILTWQDGRNGINNIYAQHLNPSSTILWSQNQIAICTAPIGQNNPVITSDGNGGAIIAWQDNRNGNSDIYAQHIDFFGSIDSSQSKVKKK